MFIFWLAFALGATTHVSRTPRPWLPNDATGGAWVLQQQPVPPSTPDWTPRPGGV